MMDTYEAEFGKYLARRQMARRVATGLFGLALGISSAGLFTVLGVTPEIQGIGFGILACGSVIMARSARTRVADGPR